MKAHPLKSYVTSILIGIFLSLLNTLAIAENLTDFTSRCETELEIPQNSITGFNCALGAKLPTSQFNTACDAQALLGGPGCTANSRLGIKQFSNPDVKGAWICRKYAGLDNPDDDLYHDVAMILHNRKNGKTCFFQNHLVSTERHGPIIPGPKDANALTVWKTPPQTAGIECTGCHMNDPFIVTPHVANVFSSNRLTHFNPKGDYSVVGPDFAVSNSLISRAEGCGGLCHFNPAGGFTEDALSKHWMPPGTIGGYTPYNFRPIVGQFYTLHSNGQIWGFNGLDGGSCNGNSCPHWSLLDSSSTTTKIAASLGKLYQMRNTGLIFEFTGVQCSQASSNACPGWRMIDNNPKSTQIVSGLGSVYQMWNTGTIWKYTGTPCDGGSCPGWQQLDNNPATVQIVAAGSNLYQRHNGGAVWKYTNPNWQLIANDARTINLVADNSQVPFSADESLLYMFQKSGAIWKYTGTPCDASGACPGWQLVDFDNANTKQVVAGSNNLYRLYKNGQIWRYMGTDQSWVMLDNNPNTVEITASANGLLQRHNSGVVWRFTGTVCSNNSCPGWAPIQNWANTLSVTGARR